MSHLRQNIIRAGLETLYFSGAHLAMQPFVRGVGVILTLHHVRPHRRDAFQPNRLLEITPEFFAKLIRRLRRSGLDLISLDEMHRRMSARDFRKRFACISFDDGYRDVKQWAYPVLRDHEVPFALYIATSFADQIGELWWVALERVIAGQKRIGLVIDGEEIRFDCASPAEKREAFEQIYWWLRRRETEDEVRAAVRDLCARYGVDMKSICEELCMTWDEIAELAKDPLVTIGAHTVNHVMLKKTRESVARTELEMSRSVIEAAIGVRPQHLSYPVGDPTSVGEREVRLAGELGYKTAVTTFPGVLFAEHSQHLLELPRISINGDYQHMRYVRVLLSGSATAVWNRFRRVKAA
ncbi:MAG: polysaccharide deacetylase family protein [Pseudorhodoplanes sp.]|nr:MAG: polysaccharide deacetylase family protein [Pseudorhodoplanes sp.]